MSKERELLNRARYNLDREYCADLIDEIQELLAQPEQEQSNKWWYGKGVEDTKYFLKRKFLSVKQAKDLWDTTFKSAVPYYTFYEICVAIEQYYGIGVDDE